MSEEIKLQDHTSAPDTPVSKPVQLVTEPKQDIPTESAPHKLDEVVTEIETEKPVEPQQTPETKEAKEAKQAPEPQVQTRIIYQTPPNFVQNLLVKARATIQTRKRKKLDKIMVLFDTKPHVTTKDVEKLLRTTKRTARRYFDQLEKENRIKQVGNVGRGVFYEKI